MSYTLVIDIGKTNAKLHLHNEEFVSEYSVRCANQVQGDGPYPHFSSETLWRWLISSIGQLEPKFKSNIESICVTTHGATAALIDSKALPGKALTLPILDYEYTGLEGLRQAYEAYRPDFSESLSPALPAGLNLGMQLFWLQHQFPEEFNKATHILMYPQYWSWLFSGELCSEVSSLGCHSDLWDCKAKRLSSLVEKRGWAPLFPPLRSAWEVLACLRPELADELGLSRGCKVHVGVHDSNASYLRYLSRNDKFCVFSTGTWTIAMTSACDPSRLDQKRDMLANTAVNQEVVACSRFMGGREYETICARVAAEVDCPVTEVALQALFKNKCFALPNFCPGTGPYPAARAQIVGEVSAEWGGALATLYCALMMDVQAELLGGQGDIIIEGAFLRNLPLCEIFAALRAEQQVYLSADDTGTVQGCAQLASWSGKRVEPKLVPCKKADLPELNAYRDQWRELVKSC